MTPTIINRKENTMDTTNTKDGNTKDGTTEVDQIDDAEIMVQEAPTKASRKLKTPKVAKPTVPDVRILKVSRCPSLSGRSELTYHIGCIGHAIQIRVYGNSGKGYFNQEWVAYSAIEDLLTEHEEFSAGTLRSIFIGKSVNTAGFFLAVLKHLGLIETSKTNQRLYTPTQSLAFEKAVKDLIASDVSIEIEEPLKIRTGRKGKISREATPAESEDTPSAVVDQVNPTNPSSKKGTLKLKKA